jgi:hypothetical protein
MLKADRLREVLSYDPDTGNFFWRFKKPGRNMFKPVGTITSYGHLCTTIDGEFYYMHRLAWLYMKGVLPEDIIDHIDCNPSNNKWSNLRQASRSQNGTNCVPRGKWKGVSWSRPWKKWVARLQENKTRKHLGYFDCPAAAHFVYQVEADKIYGEYARAA